MSFTAALISAVSGLSMALVALFWLYVNALKERMKEKDEDNAALKQEVRVQSEALKAKDDAYRNLLDKYADAFKDR